MREITVGLGERSYPILVGAGARHRLLEVIPTGATRAAIVTQDTIPVTVDAGIEQAIFPIDDGEDAKCLESVEQLCRAWARWGLSRHRRQDRRQPARGQEPGRRLLAAGRGVV